MIDSADKDAKKEEAHFRQVAKLKSNAAKDEHVRALYSSNDELKQSKS